MQNSLLQFFYDSLILSNICQYLTISQKLILASTSKTIRTLMNNLIKVILTQNDLSLIQGKSPLRQLRFYFDRCLRVYKTDQHNKHQIIFTIQYPFKYQVITKFQVGNNYSVFLNNKAKAFVFKTNFLKAEASSKKPQFQTITQVKSIHCKSDKLFYLKFNGTVWTTFTDKLSHKISQTYSLINWTKNIPISKMFVSYNYVIFFPQKSNYDFILQNVILKKHELQQLEIEIKLAKNKSQEETISNYKQNKYQGEKQGQILIVLNILTNKTYMIRTPPEQIINCAVGHKQAYFLTQSHHCLFVDFQLTKLNSPHQYILNQFIPFKDKSIVKIASGHNFFLALQRDMEKLEDWSVDKVINWMRSIGFQSFVRIAMAQKLDGKKLKNIQRKYMENVLGITKANMQQKFLMQIDQLITPKKHQQDSLYVWGKNQYGQLASSSANFIANPQKIKLPNLRQNQHIDSIFCGWQQTFIRTQKGRIHYTKRYVEKKKQRQYQITFMQNTEKKFPHKKSKQIEDLQKYQKQGDSDEDEFENVKLKFTKRKKKTQEVKDKDKKQIKTAKKFQQQQKWCQSQFGKAFYVQGYKQFVFCIQCPAQHIQQPQRKIKLRTAKSILDKILWGKMNKQDFRIGYIDKQMGVIEYTTSEIQNFQIKQNRIKYFKQKGVIVWDRQNKIDHFN